MANHYFTAKRLRTLVTATLLLAYLVILLGAFTRLKDAGLGCPDWPGCFGNWAPTYSLKPMAEMIHRYFAGSLGLLIISIASWSLCQRQCRHSLPIASALVATVIFQALLGMWTVTMRLNPSIVMGHLLGGFTTLSLLWWLRLSLSKLPTINTNGQQQFTVISILALSMVIIQIALGAWTSANYAALACPDFPTCQQQWWPTLNWQQAFTFSHAPGQNFEYGVLDSSARATIHFAHRLGALLTTVVLVSSSLWLLFRAQTTILRTIAKLIMLLLVIQLSLGISNVWLQLPLPIALAHNGVAALLLLCVLTLCYVTASTRPIGKPAHV